MHQPRSSSKSRVVPRQRERAIGIPHPAAAVARRERAVAEREDILRAREKAAGLRDKAAGLRDESARLQAEADREDARDEALSVKAELTESALQLRAANEQLVIAARGEREADEANRLKDEFLATVSHELRTPLTAIIGWAQMLRLNQVKASRKRYAIDVIERNAAALTQLIEDLLDVSRITAGTLLITPEAVDLAAVIQAAIGTVEPTAAAKGIDLHLAAVPSSDPIVADPRRLQQIVWNLLANAIKFTPRGGRVDIDVRRVGSSLELRVSDTGRGISAEFLPLMFERFRQADGALSRREGGLGLGLAIVRQIVELHGWHIRVVSPGADRGTTVTIRIPILPTVIGRTQVGGIPQIGKALPDSRGLAHVHVLLVEDSQDEREFVTLVLEAAGATVTSAPSARKAREALAVMQPDVLVSDVWLPDEDGHALIRSLRGHEAVRGGFLPAIALTRHARPTDRAAAIAAGFQAYLAKPAAAADLMKAIAALVPPDPESRAKR